MECQESQNEPRTLRIKVQIFMPAGTRLAGTHLGSEADQVAALLTHHLNDSYLPAISRGMYPKCLALATKEEVKP